MMGSVPGIRAFERIRRRRLQHRLSWRDVTAKFSWARVAGALLIVLILAGTGYGGYLLGRPNANSEAFRADAIEQGREAGARKGANEGYEHGYESARKRTFASAYAAAYKEAYATEFERANLKPPRPIQVPEPR